MGALPAVKSLSGGGWGDHMQVLWRLGLAAHHHRPSAELHLCRLP